MDVDVLAIIETYLVFGNGERQAFSTENFIEWCNNLVDMNLTTCEANEKLKEFSNTNANKLKLATHYIPENNLGWFYYI